MNNMFNMFQQLCANPMQILSRRFNIPQNLTDPQQIVQHLVDSKQVTQEQVDQAIQMRDNPLFKQFMK